MAIARKLITQTTYGGNSGSTQKITTEEQLINTVTYFYGYSIIDYSVFTYSHFRQII